VFFAKDFLALLIFLVLNSGLFASADMPVRTCSCFGPIDSWQGQFWAFGEHDESGGFALPLWFAALAAGAWPLASLTPPFYRRLISASRRASQPNRCRNCGYDLRATPDADGPSLTVCPECGAANGQQA